MMFSRFIFLGKIQQEEHNDEEELEKIPESDKKNQDKQKKTQSKTLNMARLT